MQEAVTRPHGGKWYRRPSSAERKKAYNYEQLVTLQVDMFEQTMGLDDYLDRFPCAFDRI